MAHDARFSALTYPHKTRARLNSQRQQHVKKRAVDQRVPESRRVAGTPVPPGCELELPEQAFALLLWHLSAGAFCEQRKAGLRVPDQIEFIERRQVHVTFTSRLIFSDGRKLTRTISKREGLGQRARTLGKTATIALPGLPSAWGRSNSEIVEPAAAVAESSPAEMR